MRAAVLLLAAAAVGVSGKAYTWTGIVDSKWSNSKNWYPVGVPGAGDDVTIDAKNQASDTKVLLVQPEGVTVRSLSMGNSPKYAASLEVEKTLTADTITVAAKGHLALTAGDSKVVVKSMKVAGELEFQTGTLQGAVQISGFANFAGSAKTFDQATVMITSKQPVAAVGQFHLKQKSTINATTGFLTQNGELSFDAADHSGNSVQADGFTWREL